MKNTSTKIIAGAAAVILLAGGLFLIRHRQTQSMDQTKLPEVSQNQQSTPATSTSEAPQAPWRGAVQGRVLLAETREGVPNAHVLLLEVIDGNIEGTIPTTTDEAGKFDIPVDRPGTYALRAYNDTHQNLNPRIEANELLHLDESTTAVGPVDLLLHDGVALTLRVKDGDTGEVVTSFYVGLGKAGGFRECTPDNGEVTLIAPPTAFELQILAPWFQPYIISVDLSDQRPKTYDISLIRGGILRGTVTTADGEPATQAQVFLNTTPSRTRHLIFLAKTNENGDYVTGMVPRLPDTRVTFYQPGFGPETVKVDLSKPPHEDFIDVVLKPVQAGDGGFKITGKVVDPKGNPLADTDIYFGLWGGPPLKTTSAGDGSFVVEGLGTEGKTLTLVALKAGYSHPKRVDVPLKKNTTKDITLILTPVRKPFTGHVIDELGNPLADVQIHADYRTWFSSRLLMAQTQIDGAFSISYGRDFRVWFSKPGYHTEIRDLSLVSDKDFVLTLKSVGVIRGRVVDPKGRAVPEFRVQYGPKDEERVKAASFSDPSGRFELDQLPNGETYHLAVLAPGYPPTQTAPIQVLPKDEAGDNVIQLPEKGVVLEGKVVDLNHQPIAGAVLEFDGLPAWGPNLWVPFSDPPSPTGSSRFYTITRTDRDGAFRFTDLPTDYKLQMRITADGFATKHLKDANLLIPRAENTVDITMSPRASLRVFGPEERTTPLNISLFLSRKDENDIFPTTEYGESQTLEPDQESVIFEGLNAGYYQLTVSRDQTGRRDARDTDFFTIETGEQKEIYLGDQLTISGVVFMNDQPLRNGKLAVVQSQSADILSVNPVIVDTDSAGRYVVKVVSNRTYAFAAGYHRINTRPGPGDEVQTVVVKDQNVDTDLHFKGSSSVRVRVKGERPKRLELVSGDRNFQFPAPQPNGVSQLFDLDPLTYTLFWVTPSNSRIPMVTEILVKEGGAVIDLGTLELPQTGTLTLVFPQNKTENKGGFSFATFPDRLRVRYQEFPMKGEINIPDLPVGELQMSFFDFSGKYMILPHAPQINSRDVSVHIEANQVTRIEVDLSEPAGADVLVPGHVIIHELKLVGTSEIMVDLEHRNSSDNVQLGPAVGNLDRYLTMRNMLPGPWQIHLTYQLATEKELRKQDWTLNLVEGQVIEAALEF